MRTVSAVVMVISLVGAVSMTGQSSKSGVIATADGINLFYRVEGSGNAPVVLLHGGPGLSMSYLQPDLGSLWKNRVLIAYDQRGGGRSTVTGDPKLVNPAKHVDDLDAVRGFFGLERMTLIGHSWGAGLAVLYAQRFPARLDRLLLIGAIPPRNTPYMSQFGENVYAWTDDAAGMQLAELDAARRNAADPVAACRGYWAVFIRGYLANPKVVPAARGDICDAPPDAVQNQGRAARLTFGPLGDWDWRPLLKAISAPTLVMHGDRDPIPLASAREWAAGFPNARLFVVANSGHMPFVEQPATFFQAADQFLRGDWPAGSVTVTGS
jgi:proline iminopeptidase